MYDLILTGGLIVDGTGKKPYSANLCIRDGKIAAITQESVEGKETFDVSGLTVAPGFIDMHTHSDSSPITAKLPESSLNQGITTQVIGNCGTAQYPALPHAPEGFNPFCHYKLGIAGYPNLNAYCQTAAKNALYGNFAPLVGHCPLRASVIGDEDRAPTDEELQRLCDLLEQDLKNGAYGMSLGLIYPPSSFAAFEELVALAKVIAKYDGILSVHMRNEGPRIFEAVTEVLEIAKQSGVHLQISHLKLMGKPQWGKAQQLTDMIEKAQSEGVKVTCDQYPFPASSTSMTALVPRWAANGGIPALLKRVEAREGTILADIAKEMNNRGGADCVLIISAKNHPEYASKYVSDVAREFNISPEEAVRKVLLDSAAKCSCIYFSINEEDIHHIMRKPWVCVGSDGSDHLYGKNPTLHPRNFATFPQYFQTVREHNLLPLEAMVRKATGLPAQILGMKDRGTLEIGKWADIAIFDAENFSSCSTFLKPDVQPNGMQHVLVAGQFVLKNEAITTNTPGTVLLKK